MPHPQTLPPNSDARREWRDRAKLALRAREMFESGCYQGDIARSDVSAYNDRDEDVLTAISETAFKCGRTFFIDEKFSKLSDQEVHALLEADED